jgi:hypothetical protein
MDGPATPASGDRTRYRAGAPVTLDDLEVLACVYGPRSSPADVERMLSLGAGWARGIAQWRRSGAPYLLLVARTFGGGSRGEPDTILARDRAAIERAIWIAMASSDTRLCLLESFEPALVPFVQTLITASRQSAVHA